MPTQATPQGQPACAQLSNASLPSFSNKITNTASVHLAVYDVRRADGPVRAQLCGAAVNEGAVGKDDFVAVAGGDAFGEEGVISGWTFSARRAAPSLGGPRSQTGRLQQAPCPV